MEDIILSDLVQYIDTETLSILFYNNFLNQRKHWFRKLISSFDYKFKILSRRTSYHYRYITEDHYNWLEFGNHKFFHFTCVLTILFIIDIIFKKI
jgi:hypothetical protein